jgi:hypothetical protein
MENLRCWWIKDSGIVTFPVRILLLLNIIQRHAWLPYFDNVQAIIFRKFSNSDI